MSSKTERVEARLSATQRKLINQAAALEGQSLSSFLVEAAAEKAESVIAARTTTFVPTDYFDRLLAAIDEDESAPRLVRAAKRARKRQRIR